MTQEEKELLIKDISARLPYKPIVHIHDIDVIDYDNYLYPDYLEKMMSSSITLKPYLRPMWSMTQEEKQELKDLLGSELVSCSDFGYLESGTFVEYISSIPYSLCIYVIDWLNAHYFDYRGLIEKGLAIDCTNLNIY